MKFGIHSLFLLALFPAALKGWIASGPDEGWNEDVVVLDFHQVMQGIRDGNLIYLDVRNYTEIRGEGKILGSYVIPLPEMDEAFRLSKTAFHKKYCFPKPQRNMSNAVIACRSGVRAIIAINKLLDMGYTSMKLYPGGFLDWSGKGGPTVIGAAKKCPDNHITRFGFYWQ